MDRFSYKDAALKDIKTADHLLSMTYPIVRDTKLLKLVFLDLRRALENGLNALCLQAKHPVRSYMDVRTLKEIFKKYEISPGYVGFIDDVFSKGEKQIKADVEFIRKDKFVFASEDYNLAIITEPELKDMLNKVKLFLKETMEVIK